MGIIKTTNTTINDDTPKTMNDVGSMLTTIDNPWDPFSHFEEWYAFDIERGYNTLSYLAKVANVSEELSELDYAVEVENAIDEIIKYNILGLYIKIKPGQFKNRIK